MMVKHYIPWSLIIFPFCACNPNVELGSEKEIQKSIEASKRNPLIVENP